METGRKYAILVGDGMADEPQSALGGKTPLEHARIPRMDALAAAGQVRLAKTIPDGMPPGSDVANMSLMGYDPAAYYTGRAPIEAAGMGVGLAPEDTALRCNLVHVVDGRMADYSAGAIETADAHALIGELRAVVEGDAVRLHAGVSYRHLLVIREFPPGPLVLTPPHDIADRPIEDHLPRGPGSEILLDLMERARSVLAASPTNARRVAEGKIAVTDVWFWGQGAATVVPTLQERFGLTGAVISAVDLVRGLGRLAGMTVLRVPGATGYLDTDYAGKVEAAAKALETMDLVYIHVEAPDETSHEGSLEKKLRAIEDFDARVVGPISDLRGRHPGLRILVLPDHATLLRTRTHHPMPVPFLVSGPGIEPDASAAYSERAARTSPPFTGATLFDELVRGEFR